MIILKRIGLSSLVVAGLALAASAHAQGLGASVNLNATTGVNAIQSTTSVRSDITTGSSASSGSAVPAGSMRTSVSATGSSATGSGTGVGANVGVGLGSSSASGSASSSADEDVSVTRSDIATGNVQMADSSSVSTTADLQAYARAVVASDEKVTKVQAQNDEVSVSYKEPAKLLGFIPVTVSVTAVTKADGSTTVDYPWYGFLTASDDTKLKSDLDLAAGSIARAEGTASFSTSAKARLIDAMKSVMKSHYEATVSADASTTGEIEAR